MKIEIIMLAAGNSRRFGSNKLLHQIGGLPMYAHILGQLEEAAELLEIETGLTVVTQYEEIAEAARAAGAEVLYNPHPEEGISSSLKIGLKANRTADACLFTVADQPWLSAGTVARLVTLFLESGKGMACVSAGGKSGNPCIFSQKYYPELMELYGDIGGKHVITAHRNDTAVLELENAKELTDIDTRHSIE